MNFVEAAEAADETTLQSLLAAEPGLRDEHADLVPRLAESRNWSALRLLVTLGFEVNGVTSDGVTPLHHAAAAGELATVRVLVEHGADPTAREPQFGAQPAGWAQYFKKRETQEYLESLA
ncbi:ankyrin repeat domain-containing protein [Saccharopolyspora sp. K220]|uniref:ankyrin repeat domain-containing protein n=1 Tax=Saccharopolyspora soli TaxID=2926618 RepID=UPI001F5884F9|nr:ankyrin repeat domain-containing protein [Saccharopolyspora soli]MCI2415952.1 ankyrin repeat domain-containing protein [Saccharopolyspora soli]